MKYQHYFDPIVGHLSNLFLGLVMDLLMSTAMVSPFLAGKSKYQALKPAEYFTAIRYVDH